MTIISQTTYSGPATQSAAPAPAPAAPVANAPAPAGAPVAPIEAAPAPAPAITLDDPAKGTEAVPAVPAPVVVDTSAKGEISYEKTGNASLDMALGFLGKNGYGPEHPAMLAAADGNFGLLKAELAAKGVAGWAEHLALGEEAYKSTRAEQDAKSAKDKAAIFDIVGGEKQWGEIQKWASTNAEPAERSSINAAMQQGGIVAKATAKYLADLYGRAAGTVVEPATVAGKAAAGSAPSTGVLDPAGYKAAILALKSKVGSANMDHHPEYAALKARRSAWRG